MPEIRILRDTYPIGGYNLFNQNAKALQLPTRTRPSIVSKAKELGLTGPVSSKWTDKECKVLKTHYQNGGWQLVLEKLIEIKKKRSPQAIKLMALKSGLSRKYNKQPKEKPNSPAALRPGDFF